MSAVATRRKRRDLFPHLLVLPVLLVLIPFFLFPLAVLLRNSLYRDDPRLLLVPDISLQNYAKILSDGFYAGIFINSLGIALLIAAITLFVAYPLAWYMVQQRGRKLTILLWCVYLPLIVSVISRVYGWMIITADSGLINSLLLWSGLIERPIRMLFDPIGMTIGMVHRYLPLMILPLYSALNRLDRRILSASRTLGASGAQSFFRVILPLSLPGIFVGIQLTVAVVLSDYVLPFLLGSSRFPMVAPAIHDEALSMLRWASAAAMAVVTILAVAIVIIASNLLLRRLAPWSRTA